MNATYPATYRDRYGEVRTSIHNDGTNLSMKVRGITFSGTDFDGLEAPDGMDVSGLTEFASQSRCLYSCVIETPTLPRPAPPAKSA